MEPRPPGNTAVSLPANTARRPNNTAPRPLNNTATPLPVNTADPPRG
jgi:hypothetical protein